MNSMTGEECCRAHHHSMRAMGDGKKAVSMGSASSGSLWGRATAPRHHSAHHELPEESGRKRKKAGRRIVVGMKLTAACREVLTWTIAKLAHPGDHVVALHVSSFPSQTGAGGEDAASEQQQLASSLRTVLSVYEGLCNLKQIKLQLQIVNGTKVRRVLVEAARTYEAYKLILGTTKQHAIGWSASLGKYCLKRLPATCTVVIVEHGKIIFDKKGTQIDTPGGSLMMKVLRRSVRSIGRSKKVSVACLDDDTVSSFSTSPTTTDAKEAVAERDRDFDSRSSSSSGLHDDDAGGSGSPISVLPAVVRNDSVLSFDAFRLSYSKRRMEGSISKRTSSLRVEKQHFGSLRGAAEDDEDDSIEELDPYPTEVCNSDDESKFSVSVYEEVGPPPRPPTESAAPRGWPLMHHSISFDNKPLGQTLDRSMSVVNWALQLPHAERAFMIHGLRKADLSHAPPSAGAAGGDEFHSPEVRLSFSLPHVRTPAREAFQPSRLSTVTRHIDRLCLDRPCVYTYEELDAATSSFSPSNLVGIGGGSQVYRGETHDGRLVAVKLLNQGRPQAEEELLTDIEINSSLKHRHIVALLGYCVDATHLILVYDFLAHGNLDDHLHGGKEAAVVAWEVRHRVAIGIARALDYLHDGCPRPVVHRDVKASNILLSASFDPQLSDFGLAKWAPTDAPFIRCNDVVGTFGYLAPEYFMYGRVNEKTDVYSFGVVLLELITGRQPIDTTKPKGQENLVLWARPLLEEKNLDILVDPRLDGRYDVNQLKSMMVAAALCIRHSAHRRPHMSRVLKILSGEGESLGYWSRHELTNKSVDMDESGPHVDGAADYGDTDIQTHLALAMLGVDDDESSSNDQSGALAHSNTYLEEYLEGRCSRSTSFNG